MDKNYKYCVGDLVRAPSGSGKLLPAYIVKVTHDQLIVEYIAKQLGRRLLKVPCVRVRASCACMCAKRGVRLGRRCARAPASHSSQALLTPAALYGVWCLPGAVTCAPTRAAGRNQM